MKFASIAITKKGVTTVRASKDDGGEEDIVTRRREKPLAAFSDALQGFKPYVLQLFEGAVTIEEAKLKITTLNFSEDKNGLRGLIVTGIVPVAKAYGKPLVLNTPLVREGSENASTDAFVLSDEVLSLIEVVEDEATRYLNGEREQLELMPPDKKAEKTTSENAKAFDERAAAAEVATSRNPKTRGSRKKPSSPGDAEAAATTWNPEKTNPPTTPLLRQLLLTVERDVPEDAIEHWTSSERDGAQQWAEARQKEILGQLKSDRMPREPEWVIKASTPSLADGWSDEKPARPDVAGIESIKAEANRTPVHLH